MLLIIIILIQFIVYQNSIINFTTLPLKDKISPYLLNYTYNYSLSRCDNQNIYGLVYHEDVNNNEIKTDGYYIYNIVTSDLKYFTSHFNDEELIDFYINNDNSIYFITLNNNSNWKLYYQKEDKKSIIKKGHILNLNDIPRLVLFDDNIIFINKNVTNNTEKYQIGKLQNNIYDIMIEESGNININNGNLLYNMSLIYSDKYYIYYTLVDENHSQILRKISLSDNSIIDIYINENNEYLLYNFKIVNNLQYIQLINREETDKSIVIIRNPYERLYKGNVKTMDKILGNGVLFHNNTGEWEIIYNNTFKSIPIIEKKLEPNYIIYDNKKIIIKNNANEVLISDPINIKSEEQ